MSTRVATLTIGGMTCSACVASVEGAARGVSGVKSIQVALLAGKGEAIYDASATSATAIADAIDSIGFDVSVTMDAAVVAASLTPAPPKGDTSKQKGAATTESSESRVYLNVDHMTCGSCVASVEGALQRLRGVRTVSVALLAGKAVVDIDPTQVTPEKVRAAVDDIGFDCTLQKVEERAALKPVALETPDDGSVGKSLPVSAGSGASDAAVRLVLSMHGGTSGDAGATALATATLRLHAGRAALTATSASQVASRVQSLRGIVSCASLAAAADAGHRTSNRRRPGVVSAAAHLQVQYDSSSLKLRRIFDAVESVGYRAEVVSQTGAAALLGGIGADTHAMHERLSGERSGLLRLLVWATLFTLPVFVLSMVLPMVDGGALRASLGVVRGVCIYDVILAALAFPVQVGSA
jgi:copper ion binding protein